MALVNIPLTFPSSSLSTQSLYPTIDYVVVLEAVANSVLVHRSGGTSTPGVSSLRNNLVRTSLTDPLCLHPLLI
jgi:hypothetical protein